MLAACAGGRARASAPRVRQLVLAWAVGVSLACASTPLPCRSPGTCSASTECLAQRCVPFGAEPVTPGAGRLVLEPADVRVVLASSADDGGLPPSVTFGGAASAGDELLVRFGGNWRARDVVAAFLLLEPAASAEPSAGDVQLEVALASRAWSSRRGAHAVSSRAPIGAALARTRPPAPLRVDVTLQLHQLGDAPGDDHGFVVRAARPSARGAVYSTGANGQPPRLDLYLRPRPATP